MEIELISSENEKYVNRGSMKRQRGVMWSTGRNRVRIYQERNARPWAPSAPPTSLGDLKELARIFRFENAHLVFSELD